MATPIFEVLGEDITVILQAAAFENGKNDAAFSSPSTENKNLRSLEELILEDISANPKITLTEIAAHASVSKRSVQYAMNRLVHLGIIKREGTTRTGKWTIL